MFEGKPDFQRIVRLGILGKKTIIAFLKKMMAVFYCLTHLFVNVKANLGYNVEYDNTGAEDYDFSPYMSGVHSHGFGGNRASSSSPQRLPYSGGATNASVSSQFSHL